MVYRLISFLLIAFSVIRNEMQINVDTIDTVEGVCNGFLPYTRFLGFPEFSGYHQWQQESQ